MTVLMGEGVDEPVEVYVDGSYDAACKAGGWAFVAVCGGTTLIAQSGRISGQTNNTLELLATLKAMEWVNVHLGSRPVTIWSDSAHVVEGCNHWRAIWKSHGWKRYSPNPRLRNRKLADADLWKSLDRELSGNARVTVAWCKGHDGNPGNELADQLASAAQKTVYSNLPSEADPPGMQSLGAVDNQQKPFSLRIL